MNINQILEQVKQGDISINEAEQRLKELPYKDMGFARIDHHRKLRSGFGEVIFCQSKTNDHLLKIYQHFADENLEVLGTRASADQYNYISAQISEIEYDPISRILKLEKANKNHTGLIAVCTGGTTDIPVAEEAAQVAEFFGSQVLRIYDVGVAGIHRLFSKIEEINKANCIIAVAGMEGALPGVLAGMVDKPVIAVPTSIGYGACFNGISALLTMLNSCAEGISVVNIDNGFGAGYLATQINRLATKI
ncbi:MAG: 1-(5-phosphoribosyl)-5-amino-4-imidazole-carboxylate carboxylase [Candidatus Epulonipiscioides saccharophilum]|nr:MAG: 1-(5-phosphoribosyl)-5-amino-4-imidazole-carboxylate carboxylase [Epulopiscium sp. AS2M-Bin001]